MRSPLTMKLLAVAGLFTASIAPLAAETVPVHVLNFIRAETDQYFARYVAQGALGQFVHVREPVPIEQQDVIRMNRDTLYSIGVFDLTTPVTIMKPEPAGRFQSLLTINQDHYVVGIEHDGGDFTFTQEQVGTRYLFIMFRTFVDPQDPADVAKANALQDAIRIEQSDRGEFDVPDWDTASLDRMRAQIQALVIGAPTGSEGLFGSQEEVDPIKHLVGTAVGWGGNPETAALYDNFYPAEPEAPHALTVKDVPVDGFWSITLYNGDGYMQKNDSDAYSVNNVTANRNADGSVTVHFGDCADNRINCLPIMEGWNYVVRMYQPRQEILDGSWKFPAAKPMN